MEIKELSKPKTKKVDLGWRGTALKLPKTSKE